jgi:hypothetical protein
MYGVMVIDMGVHQLSGLVQKFNLTQVGSLVAAVEGAGVNSLQPLPLPLQLFSRLHDLSPA